jgi:glycosyltransferase involved in cell wall biosynthesis
MVIVHLTSSAFFGGPERQMLGLARSLASDHESVFLSFSEGGRCRPFLEEARRHGFEALELDHDTPYLWSALGDLTAQLRRLRATVLCCHGYKADLLGRLAARRLRIPAVAVSRGWTGESLKVRLYEALDRLHLRWMDRVVCVSEGQAIRVRRAGVPAQRVSVIHNAIRPDRFQEPAEPRRELLQGFFAEPRSRIVGAAGRLSPEKGFGVLIEAAKEVVRQEPSVGFLVFGDGPLRQVLSRQIERAGLKGHCVLAGFRDDLDRLLPSFDLLVLPSYTEGLPNVVLEALAARVPVVATAVGGTPEVIDDGVSGYLVPPGSPGPLAQRILQVLHSEAERRAMGERGRERVLRDFTFETQGLHYRQLFRELLGATGDADAEARAKEMPASALLRG